MKKKITKTEFYALGGFSNPKLVRKAKGATMAEHILRDGFEVVRIANEVDVRDAK